MYKQLLFKHQNKKQLYISLLGILVGCIFLACATHYYFKIQSIGKAKDALGSEIMVLQKKVSNYNTLNIRQSNFSNKDIEMLNRADGIEDVQPLTNNSFSISLETNDQLLPYFRSSIFAQSVSKRFLDFKDNNWKWTNAQQMVPIILPRDFLIMLNTFMNAKGIPQLSEDLIKQVNFKFTIGDGINREWHNVRIMGFTNEFSSILIPEEFMQYCERKFGSGDPGKITQVLIKAKENEFGKVEQYMKKKGLEARNSQLITGRLKSILSNLIVILMSISVLTLLLSALLLIQYIQLLITKNSYQIQILLQIGYYKKQLIWAFMRYFSILFGVIILSAALFFLLIKKYIDLLIDTGGIPLNKDLSFSPFLAIILCYFIFILAGYLTALREIKSYYR